LAAADRETVAVAVPSGSGVTVTPVGGNAVQLRDSTFAGFAGSAPAPTANLGVAGIASPGAALIRV
jgi:hypothetical protein